MIIDGIIFIIARYYSNAGITLYEEELIIKSFDIIINPLLTIVPYCENVGF